MKKKSSPILTLTDEQIEQKKLELEARFKKSIEEKKQGRKSPAKKFLIQIEELVRTAIKNELSYRQIAKDIKDIYNFKISEQTIRSFAHNTLKIPKKLGKNKDGITAEAVASNQENSGNSEVQTGDRKTANIDDV